MIDDKHFDKVFWFIVGITGAVILFDACVIFVPVPTGGQKYADILLGALNTGTLMAGIQWLLGGTPNSKKEPQVPVTGNQPNVVVNPPIEP